MTGSRFHTSCNYAQMPDQGLDRHIAKLVSPMMIAPGIVASAGSAAPPPLTPLAVADFKNGVYSIGGVSKTVLEFFAEDALNFGTFDPVTDISAGVGLISGNPIVNHSWVAGLLSGFTAVMEWSIAPGGTFAGVYLLDLPGYAVTLACENLEVLAKITDYTATETTPLTAGTHKTACTISNSSMGLSVDGAAPVTFDPINGSPTDVGISISSATLSKITFYAPQDNATLQVLSA